MFVIACYDISSNKLRKEISVILSRYGIRVQKSIFELDIEKNKDYNDLKKEIEKLIKKYIVKNIENLTDVETTETVRFYILWKTAKAKIDVIWNGENVYDVPSYVII